MYVSHRNLYEMFESDSITPLLIFYILNIVLLRHKLPRCELNFINITCRIVEAVCLCSHASKCVCVDDAE